MKSMARAGHMSPSRTPPLANQLTSILLPINQKYLASKGYYRQQGWPKGTFEDADEESQKENKEKKDAATKRKHFQKMKTNRQWSLCDSGEQIQETPSQEIEWRSQSFDDSLSLDETNERSLRTCFSTNTESSTDSLETPNIETEKAFAEIRRQYNESLARKRSSDDLFLPYRSKDHEEKEINLDLLNTNDVRSNNYFISPASSRQATVEKAPTLTEQPRVSVSDDIEESHHNKKDGNNNKNLVSACHQGEKVLNAEQDFSMPEYNDSSTDVRIIVSGSDSLSGKRSPSQSIYDDLHAKSSGKLSVKTLQRASSDSGSTSSSGTAIGSCSIATAMDDVDTLRYIESDRDSLSGAISPYSFSQKQDKSMSSISCQTYEADFKLAATISARSIKKAVEYASGVRPGTGQKKGSKLTGNVCFLEESPRVQLSALPSSINPLELMKRLQNSQDELSRMGSVQSDSSGFGDFDPTAETGNQEAEYLKQSGMHVTASHNKPGKGEIGTQTSLDSPRISVWREANSETNSLERNNSRFDSKSTRYVTMCYIPSLGAKVSDASQADLKNRASRSDHSLHLRARASDAGHHDQLGFTRPRGFSDVGHHLDYVDHYHGKGGESKSDSPRVSSLQYAINRTYDLNSPQKRNVGRRSETDIINIDQRKFTSNLDLYTDEAGLHTKSEKSISYQRSRSDDGILNDTPLSVEIAQATSAIEMTRSSAATITSSVYVQPSTNALHTGHTPIAGNISRITPDSNYSSSQLREFRRNFSQQRSCDILEDDFSVSDGDLNLKHPWTDSRHQDRLPMEDYLRLTGSLPPSSYAYSLPPLSMSRTSDDFETYSSLAESSSDYSVQSYPEGRTRSDILDSRRLAQLINQPTFFRGKRRNSSHYRPRRLFKEWSLLSKRKRLQEENRLLQYAVQKYKTELNILETSFMIDYQTVYPEMSQEEREEIEELEYLWAEVRHQVLEMEQLLLARVKSVHAGNDFHSLMSTMGIINKMIEIIKEQMYLQQVASTRAETMTEDDIDNDIEALYADHFMDRRPDRLSDNFTKTSQSVRKSQSSSMSNIPTDLNISLEQIKSSLLSQVQKEIKESTKKLELNLQEKDKEIKELKERLSQSSETQVKPIRRWTPKSSRSKSFTSSSLSTPTFSSRSVTSTPITESASRKRSRLMGDKDILPMFCSINEVTIWNLRVLHLSSVHGFVLGRQSLCCCSTRQDVGNSIQKYIKDLG
ncbi:hypothetical protein Btru_013257 [Bulinus truncatus]|nr:hypothetical protein Btru_013257 [Bulinus truncatus]